VFPLEALQSLVKFVEFSVTFGLFRHDAKAEQSVTNLWLICSNLRQRAQTSTKIKLLIFQDLR
jgi:hypothetical protein